MSRWVNVSGNVENNKVNVTTPDSSDSVNATNNNAKYYSDLAKQYSESAQISAEYSKNAKIWAEGTDEEVKALGGEHSAKTWAELLAEGTGGKWGTIIGNITEQYDLMEQLDNKANTSYVNELVEGFEEALEDKASNDNINSIYSVLNELNEALEYTQDTKQDKLTAGENITIVDNVISAEDGINNKVTNCILAMPENAISNPLGTTFYLSPEIKALIPNGFNIDGTYNNIEWTNENEIMQNVALYDNSTHLVYIIEQDQLLHSTFLGRFAEAPSIEGANGTYYNTTENCFYLNGGTQWIKTPIVFLAELTATDGVITTFKPKQPFRLVTYDDIKDNVYITETYKNGTSWYNIYSNRWCEQGGKATHTGTIDSGNSETVQITFAIPFSDTSYSFVCSSDRTNCFCFEDSSEGERTRTRTNITIGFRNINQSTTSNGTRSADWQAKGYI